MKFKKEMILAMLFLCIAIVTLVVPAAATTEYVTYLGGNSSEFGEGIAVDDAGNTYIVGDTSSTDFPITADAYQPTFAGSLDTFVAKFDSTSNLTYCTYLGGSDSDYGYGIAVDDAGNIYVSGRTRSTDFPTTQDAYQPANAGWNDAFLAKFDSTGNLTYCTYLGGSDSDYGYGIVVDGAGNAYITGYTRSTDFPTTQDAYQSAMVGGSYNAFLAKFDSTGNLTYCTYLSGSNSDYGYGIAVDDAGNIYVSGRTRSTDFPTTQDAYQATIAVSYDAFAARFDSTGNLTYCTYLGGSDIDCAYGIAVDDTGNAYITGYTFSLDFPITADAYQPANAGWNDGFLAKFDCSGNLTYCTYLGGSDGDDYGNGIAVDDTGNAYITGYTFSLDFPITADAYQPANAGSLDTFVAKFDSTGNLTYCTYLGGSDNDYGYGIAVDDAGNAYFTGYTRSTGFPTTQDAYQPTNAGLFDAFFAQMTVPEKTTSEAIQGIIESIGTMDLTQGIESKLTVKLNAALESLEKGNINPAKNQLNACINEIAAQVGKAITEEQAVILTANIQKIIQVL